MKSLMDKTDPHALAISTERYREPKEVKLGAGLIGEPSDKNKEAMEEPIDFYFNRMGEPT